MLKKMQTRSDGLNLCWATRTMSGQNPTATHARLGRTAALLVRCAVHWTS